MTLDPTLDTLVNVNAFGEAVPSARFMGGREHDIALGETPVDADDSQILEVLTERAMLLPALVSETGPFAGAQACWHGEEPAMATGRRSAAVGFCLALVTARCLELIGHDGPVIVEGPFSRSKPYLWMLGAASSSPVVSMDSATGTSRGAALLVATGADPKQQRTIISVPEEQIRELLSSYAREWKAKVAAS